MAEPIYKMFMARPSEHWYQLSKPEQASLLAQVNAALEEVGGKRVLYCDSVWQSEEWYGFGVERFPDLAALQKFQHTLLDIGWLRCIESRVIVGTEANATT